MGTWNHRILKGTYSDGTPYCFPAEVHYRDDEATEPNGYGTAVFDCESIEDIKWVIERLKEALDKPVLDADQFNSGK